MRYRRQSNFPGIGLQGQEKLARSRVLIVGCGALGGSVANLLVRAGVGFLRILDPDIVELENLYRQILFTEEDVKIGKSKVAAAGSALRAANNGPVVETHEVRFEPGNAEEFARDVDLIIDGSDNFTTRFLMNETVVANSIPFITAGILGASGQMMTVIPGRTPCLECLLGPPKPEPSLEIDREGILSPLVQVIAAMEAVEAMKILSGNLVAIENKLYKFDLWPFGFREFDRGKINPDCRICGIIASR